jgi:S-adenosylhomocysteine hydrolase
MARFDLALCFEGMTRWLPHESIGSASTVGYWRHLGGVQADAPADGLTIGTGIHLEAKTVALLLTLAEIDAAGLIGACEVAGRREYTDDLLTLVLKDGRRIHLLARGHMFNLAGPRPLGNSIESMDLGFALRGPVPGGGRQPPRGRHQLRRPGPRAHRRGHRQ